MTNEEHDRVRKDLQRAANDFAEYGYEYSGADELEIAARAFAREEYERAHAFCGLVWSIRCWLEREGAFARGWRTGSYEGP